MESVLLVIHLIVALSIIVIVMIQPSETGGFLGTGSMSNMLAPRRSGDVLTRATTVLAGCFFLTSLLLAMAAGHHTAAKSILDSDQPVGVNTSSPVTGTPAGAGKTDPAVVKSEAAGAEAKDAKDDADAKPAVVKKPQTPKAPISK